MRVSSNMLFDSNVAAMTQQQARLMQTQQQVSTGRKILTASDDPVAAARALDVTQSDAMNTQYAANRGAARHTLSLAESTLQGVTSLLQDVKTATVSAGSGTMNASDRRTMATDLSGRLQELTGLANSTDGVGNFLFAGFQSKTTPFVSTAAGMAYFGDDGQRNVQVSATRQMPSSGNGADMFMRIKNGNGTFVAQADAGNTGTGIISQGSIIDQTALTGDSYTIDYAGPSATAAAGNTVNGAIISTPTVVDKTALTGKDYGVTLNMTAGTYDVTDLTVAVNTQTITALDFSGVGAAGSFVVDSVTTVTLDAAYDETTLVGEMQADLDAGVGGVGAYAVTSTGTVLGGDFAVSITRAAGGSGVSVSAADANAITGGIANSPGGASVLTGQPYVSGQPISFAGLQFNIQDGGTAFVDGDTFTVLSPGYTVTDATTAAVVLPAPPATGRVLHVSGQAISFDGIQIDIQGDPVAGDTFTVSPSSNESVFKTLADLITALNAPVVGASLTNSLNHGLTQLDNALDKVLTTRSSLGLRLNEIDALQTAGEDLGLQFKQTLSELQDVDYNQAISDLVRQQTNLQAAQQTFSKVAGLSLFDYI
ncbi:MAG: flagellar hook-associated protein FlgL [Gallionella sp.]|nr:flagellar hook-associated protein FlgL [Gallionella sp.]